MPTASLQEVCTNLLALEGKLKHIKLNNPPKGVHLVIRINAELPLHLSKSIMICLSAILPFYRTADLEMRWAKSYSSLILPLYCCLKTFGALDVNP